MENTTIEKIAKNLKYEMDFKKITPYQLIKKHGLPRNNVHAVLQMGKKPAKGYNIQSLFAVLDATGIELRDII